MPIVFQKNWFLWYDVPMFLTQSRRQVSSWRIKRSGVSQSKISKGRNRRGRVKYRRTIFLSIKPFALFCGLCFCGQAGIIFTFPRTFIIWNSRFCDGRSTWWQNNSTGWSVGIIWCTTSSRFHTWFSLHFLRSRARSVLFWDVASIRYSPTRFLSFLNEE